MMGRAKCPPHSFYSGKRPKDIASRETLPLPIMPANGQIILGHLAIAEKGEPTHLQVNPFST
jgi:hypothetical protein